MSAYGFPDGQEITQWLGQPIDEQIAYPIGAGAHAIGPAVLANFASIIVALKPTGGQVTVTITQTINGGPPGLQLVEQVVVAAGATLFEAFVLFADQVTVTLQGAAAGTTVDYAIYPSNTTTNAQVITSATINLQHNDVLVAAEPTVDFVDGNGITWVVADDAANTRVKVTPAEVWIGCRAYSGVLLGTANAINTRGAWDTFFDQVGGFSFAGGDLVVPLAGRYLVTVSLNWTPNAAGSRNVSIVCSAGGTLMADDRPAPAVGSPAGAFQSCTVVTPSLVVGAHIWFTCWQNSGGALSVPAGTLSGTGYQEVTATWLGA